MSPDLGHPSPVRVQKFLSQKGICSRREAEDCIRQGRLKINGKTATLGDKAIDGDILTLDGTQLAIPTEVQHVVLAFNKPMGVETTLSVSPEGNKTLLDFEFGVGRVFPIGRLDKNSHGLLLLTNDGELANQMMHPRYEKTKEYLVKLNKTMTDKDRQRLTQGIKLGKKQTAPCEIEQRSQNVIKITLHEGRNRQIRRMCGALGYEVLDLQRIQFGAVPLGDLKPGNWETIDLTKL